jgi:ABC-type multidrug transport system ATPase subunit
MESKLAIAWIDLKFSASSMIGQNPKPILNKINGFINFGSLNALMGPSGAGKSTLLKCINGRNTFGLGNGTQIYLNSVYEIRSCFIVQDIKEHLLTGLTASESLVYASKIKNSEEKVVVDHQKNAEKLLSDLMISDISKTVVDKCSGGEQKRLAIALELTANHKPNLLCIDEPTSGLDSNAAEIVRFLNIFFVDNYKLMFRLLNASKKSRESTK